MTTVDRTHRLNSVEFGRANPDRVHVIGDRGAWWVFRGLKNLRDHPTHAEAVRWAHARAARIARGAIS